MSDTILLFGKMVHRDALVEFKRVYLKAVEEKKDVFIYQGQEVFVPFAKYLLQYAETTLGEL